MVENPRIDELRKRLEREPGSRLFAQLAEELRKQGDHAEAIRVSREGLDKHPAYPSARMTLGRALYDSGDVAGARAEFEAVLKGAPDNILASRLLAECLEKIGELDAAVARYKATLLMAPGDKQVEMRLDELRARAKALAAPTGGQVPMPGQAGVAGAGAPAGEVGGAEEPPPIPVVAADESFELERPFEVQPPGAGASLSATIPRAAPLPPTPVEPSEFEFDTPATTLPFQPTARVRLEDAAQEHAATEVPAPPAPPTIPEASPEIVSSTLAELYFNQGFGDKAIEVYRQLIQREPANQRARARLSELEALERHLGAEESHLPPSRVPAAHATGPTAPATRRQSIERTIARLEGLLAAIRRG